jgi:hypothetical protein
MSSIVTFRLCPMVAPSEFAYIMTSSRIDISN